MMRLELWRIKSKLEYSYFDQPAGILIGCVQVSDLIQFAPFVEQQTLPLRLWSGAKIVVRISIIGHFVLF